MSRVPADERMFDRATIVLMTGDITKVPGDAVVNAANQ